jgi:hypothetical protein
MTDQRNAGVPRDQARRHFLGLAAATAARLGAGGVIAIGPFPGSASAQGLGWGVGGTPPGHGGAPKCFLKGTRIATERGDVPIEHLQIGDLVYTARGASVPVRWIGRQTFRRSAPTWHGSVAPVLIRRSALDNQRPSRDLLVSPTHRLLIDGFFIAGEDLVNGTSIVKTSPSSKKLEYFHVLLNTHEAVFAEGVAAASLQLATGDHECFDNFAELHHLYGPGAATKMRPYAPTLGSGGREHLKALLRLGVSPLVSIPDPLSETYDRVARRGEALARL